MKGGARASTSDGTPVTFDEVFTGYGRFVAAIAVRILGSDEGLEDVVQDVFLHAWKGLGGLRDAESLQAWLAKVTVRTARHALRVRRLKMLLGGAAPDYETTAYHGISPTDRIVLARVYRILDTVPVRERIPWALHVLEERPLPEVARMCECSLATVKRRIAAARARILEVLR